MSDYDEIEKTLRARLAELEERVEDIEEDLSTPGGGDLDEIALESDDDEVLISVNYAAEKEIELIHKALKRIQSGKYGQCTSCSSDIPKERLEAIPFTPHCINCAA